MIPFNYLELFFYDGEEAKRKFKKSGHRDLFDLLDSIYGIKVIDQSIRNIKRRSSELIKNADPEKKYATFLKNFKKLEVAKQKQDSQIKKLHQQIDILSTEIDKITKKKDLIYTKFSELGGKYFLDLEKNNKKLIKINEKRTVLIERLKRLSEKTIPLLFCTKTFAILEKKNEQKRIEEKLKIFKEFLAEESVKKILSKDVLLDLKKITLKETSLVIKYNKKQSQSLKIKEQKSVTDCLTQILNNIDATNEINKAIDRAPLQGDDEVKKIKQYESKILKQINKKEKISFQLHDLKILNIKTLKEKEACEKKIKIGKDQDQKTKLDRTLKVLEEFKKRIYSQKNQKLIKKLLEKIYILSRKKELIKDIEIDYEKHLVTYLDQNNRRIPKFSAGEDHIISVAWIWALSDITSKNIPFVIDTPMGSGLDEVHRKNLIEIFLRDLSSQTIILSNDDEIDDNSADLLKNIVSTSYRITNEGDETTTRKIHEK